ncbi:MULTISPECIES: ATP-binding cassette domain-containing protein [unclassified Halorhodospira]|uniref:ATP-binding cassette domain-containing protein n=1 Tax=unclassified Halorhodospira TaxID=2626748 RepID=UPI001EE85BDA|nr:MULTISPECIES: ATP-binding cassette domain-containing protein [unclassified Halorhodospira]MCG5539635.1 ATP-binding cassette domain-containing protein [Halorhodospira sp. M39old]MCG5545445.1 ATP-binding cassette domain-containing protein [Halorhodospira sp. M38]
MIRFHDITLRRGPEPLLEGASAAIDPGHKIGLIGANGSGKSTLLALLRGELATDRGEVEYPGGWRIASMAQETPALERAAVDFVLDGDAVLRAAEQEVAAAGRAGDGHRIASAHARFEAADGYSARARAEELLHGLGFAPADSQRPVSAFSGGWRVRLSLAQALMTPSDLLLLDEPTNHLDLEAVLWLEQWLREYTGTLLLISHDRALLDRVVDGVLHIEQRRLTLYSGGYSDFERQRAERLARQQALYEKQQREIAHMQRFIDRFRAKASKARAAQSRIKALERMEGVAPAYADSPFEFGFSDTPAVANPLIMLDGVDLGYAADPVLRGVALSLAKEERVGLLGPNGAGKSTLVRALAGELAPLAGEMVQASGLRVGYFAQHQLEQLDPEASPLAHLQRLSPEASPQRLRDFLGGFAFVGDQATAAVAPLSGGEKARLVLALLVWQQPNLLLLDEPTNHLDLEMRHALTRALQGFTGAVVVVSHDRSLLGATVERYWLVADGGVRGFDGDLDDYHRWLLERRRGGDGPRRGDGRGAREATPEAAHTAEQRKAQRRRQAQQRAALKPLRERAEQLLERIEACDQALARLEAQLGDPELYSGDNEALTGLLQEQGRLQRERDALEAQWIEAEEAVEAAQAAGQ